VDRETREPLPAWRTWPIGARVVVRRRLDEGGYGDVLGHLLAADDDGVLVETRHGEVRVPAERIATGKIVPERRDRQGPSA
jgi:hypothetical protein